VIFFKFNDRILNMIILTTAFLKINESWNLDATRSFIVKIHTQTIEGNMSNFLNHTLLTSPYQKSSKIFKKVLFLYLLNISSLFSAFKLKFIDFKKFEVPFQRQKN
jgi:hypothetical protein